MAGTKLGGVKARDTNQRIYGKDFYKKIGAMGGKVSHPETRGFSNLEFARKAGKKGGQISKRGPARKILQKSGIRTFHI